MKRCHFATIFRIVCFLIIIAFPLLTGCLGRTEGGLPGIVVGTGTFKRTLVSPLIGWVQTGIYDSTEGFEIAVLSYGKITFLDPKTYAAKRTVPVHDDRVGYKELVSLRADGKLNLMAGGGGYSDVGLFDLDGHSLWQFKVKSPYNLPPNKMIAVDLDDDGIWRADQTSSEGGNVFIFDQTGKTVFKQSIGNWGVNNILAVRFKAGEPPYLVVVGGRGGGTTLMSLSIFSHNGTLVYQENRRTENLKVISDDATGVDTLLLCTGGITKIEKL